MRLPSVVLFGFCGALCLGVAMPPVAAGDPKAKVEFSYRLRAVEETPDPKKAPMVLQPNTAMVVRPNTELAVELFVKNTEPDKKFANALKDVTVKLMRLDGAGPVPLATAKLDKVDKLSPGEEARLAFAADKLIAEVGKGPVPALELWLDAKLGNVPVNTVKQKLEVEYVPPGKYVDVIARQYNAATGRISFTMKLKESFVGPPCQVELILDPAYVPGLKPLKSKTLKGELAVGQQLELYADLEFESALGAPGDASVFLDVDGYERAFEYEPNFDVGGQLGSPTYLGGNDVVVRFRTPRYVAPANDKGKDKKKPHEVRLEVDARQINRPAIVEFGINRSENSKDDKKMKIERKTGLRDVKLGIGEKNGDLLLTMSVKDWIIPVQTAEMLGMRWLRVRVLDQNGKMELPLSSAALKVLAVDRGILAPLTMEAESNQVFAPITIDNTPVKFVKFGMPRQADAGKDVLVKIETEDRERFAPVKGVIFYLGKKSEDKIEGQPVPGRRNADGSWSALMRMPEKDGKHEVAVQIVTQTDVVSAASDFIGVRAVKPADVLTTITGSVIGIDKIIWAGATVELRGAKEPPTAKPKDTQKTDEKGVFTFENVPPGAYIIFAKRQTSALLTGQATVTVVPGMETVTKDVTIKR